MPVLISRATSGPRKTIDCQKMQPDVSRKVTNNAIRRPNRLIKFESIGKLKESTKKLLCLMEEIQTKTCTEHNIHNVPITTKILKSEELTQVHTVSSPEIQLHKVTESETSPSTDIKLLETQNTDELLNCVEDHDDDCSVFKRLTRKCNCLNRQEYNDFMIHFNEDNHYSTSRFGEVIKNLRILKKFLYMGGNYTIHALMFLNEGFQESSFKEKVEISQGCAHSDICNVFENHSMVVSCIIWPCSSEYYGDARTQRLAAEFLKQLAQIEEGRHYLNYTSKIMKDLKKVIRNRSHKLDPEVIETLNSTLNFLQPKPTLDNEYYLKNEGFGNHTIHALLQYRHYMMLDEILSHLDLLNNFSNEEKGKTELISNLPSLLALFKEMLTEFDNSEMNIIITNVLNNIISEIFLKQNIPKTSNYVSAATEPIEMVNQHCQMTQNIYNMQQKNKFKSCLGISQNKFRHTKRKERSQVIIVPVEK